MGTASDGEILVLHAEDDPDFADLTADFLKRKNDRIEVVTAPNTEDALERLGEGTFDCILSDYNMPRMNGIEFLKRVREEWPDIPFILFTGKGSEEVASDAISAGVTDYLQKQAGSDQYTVLSNRIENAVAQYRAEQEIEQTTEWYSTILKHSSDYVMIVDPMGKVDYISPSVERVLGYTPDDLEGDNSFERIHPDDLEWAATKLSEVIEYPEEERTVEFRSKHRDGSWRWLEVRGRSLLDTPIINGIMVNVRDITERKKREKTLKQQKERLQDLTSFMSHDVRNQLAIISGQLELARGECESDHLETADSTVDRVVEMVDRMMEWAEEGGSITDVVPVELASVADVCWRNVKSESAELVVDSDVTVDADDERLRALLENLFLNALEHAGADVTIHVGGLDDDEGFYVADDGPGIPAGERDQVFDFGYSTDSENTGFGLTIVEQIVETHGWRIDVAESESGGARLEIHTG